MVHCVDSLITFWHYYIFCIYSFIASH